MKIVSWNVNGIRSVFNKGFLEWFSKQSPDILCLQETKAQPEQFPKEVIELATQLEVASAEKKGYSGVATFSQKNILDTKTLNKKEFDSEGRTLIHEYQNFYLINNYFPNGQRDHSRVDYKLSYCEAVLKKAKQLEKKKPVILTGDFNTAHHPIDLANPKTNTNTTGFLLRERQWLDKLEENGFIDIFRKLHPNEEGHYTWWTYRNNCRSRNIGWRIDYFFISKKLEKKIIKAEILHQDMGSDHCPLSIELAISE